MKAHAPALGSSARRWLASIALGGLCSAHAGSFSNDFESGLPAGTTAHGSATVSGGILELTPATNNQTGSLVLDDLDAGEFVTAFSASFGLRIGGGTGADGFSFVFGPSVPDAAFGHQAGSIRELVVSFDTYDNGGTGEPGINIYRGGFLVASHTTDVLSLIRTDNFEPVTITVDTEGRLSLTIDGTIVFDQVPGAFMPTFGRFGVGAACSALNDVHAIDDLSITTTTASPGDLFTIESEMFDTGSGGNVAAANTMPYLGDEYAGLSATHGVDYLEDTNNGVQNNYRTTENPNVPMLSDVGGAPWTRRPGFTVTTNHRIGYIGAGQWSHYTRTIPAGHYRVIFAASHVGAGPSDIRGRFHVLYDGHGTNQPRLWEVGAVSAYGTGAWAHNHFMPVKRPDGSDAVIGLPGGQVTLRYAPESGDPDWFMLVPVTPPAPEADLLVRVGTSDPFAGDNIFQPQPSGDQVVDDTAVHWQDSIFEVRVTNDSAAARTLTVKALEDAATGWTLGCEVAATDVLADLLSTTGHTTAELAPGASETISVTFKPDLAVPPGSAKQLTLGVFDDSLVSTPRDTVRVVAAVADLVSGRQSITFSWQADGPVGSSFSASGLPPGLGIAPATGLITGTPTQAGSFDTIVTATHPSGVTHRTIRIIIGKPIPTNGLLSGWLAENDATDSYGSYPGTLQSGTTFVAGPLGKAFSFDGVDDHIDLGAWFDLQTFTMAFWVKPDPSQVTYADIMDNYHDSNSNWVIQWANTSDAIGTNWLVALNGIGTMNLRLVHQTWQHVAVTVNGSGGAKLYLDGREVGSLSTANSISYNGNQFLRFGRHNSLARPFNGAIDDILCYDRALTGSEVASLVNSPSPATPGADADLLVRAGTSGAFAGEDVFEFIPSAAQTAATDADPANPAVFEIQLRNDAPYSRPLKVRAIQESTDNWSIACLVGTNDIAAYLLGTPGYTTAELAPGASETITVELTPSRVISPAATGALEFRLLDGGAVTAPLDSVRVEASAVTFVQPDLLIRRGDESIEAGDNIYNTTAAGQQRRRLVPLETTAEYDIRLTNDGNALENILVQGPAATAGWTVSYLYDRNYASFDGYDDYINLGAWSPGTRWTTEAWVRPSALPAGRHSIAGGFAEGRDWGITLQDGFLGVVFKPISGAATLTTKAPAAAAIDDWIHVAGTCDGTTAKLFLNGTEVASDLVQVDYDGTAAGARIGGEVCCGGNGFPGLIRDVRVWDFARDATAITATMNSTLGGTETGLLGYWPLDNESGTTTPDFGPNGLHGTFANGAGWTTISDDVTAQVTGAGFLSASLRPDDTPGRVIHLQVTPGAGVGDGELLDLLVTGTSNSDPARVDSVRAITHANDSSPPAGGLPVSASYSNDAEFEFGSMLGVENQSAADQLQLSEEQITLPFIWVPNSNQGSVSKVDTRTGRELGRYRVCPSAVYGNPSRTTIDQLGNCWVGNRRTGTAVKIGLLENGQWIDRNQNGVADTSRDLDGDGVITGAEFLDWGEDECVLVETVLIAGKEGAFTPGTFTAGYTNDDWNPGARSLAVDGTGNLWVGSWGLKKFHYLDGTTGAILRSVDVSSVNHTPYGALIDGQGILWSSSHDKQHVLRLDPTDDSFSTVSLGNTIYGLGIDADNHLFVSGWQTSKLHRIDVLTDTVEWTLPAAYESRGVAVTADGDVWTANSGPATVTRFSNGGLLKATIPVGVTPTGVAVDAADRVWVVHNGDDTIRRIDPATNSVDLVKSLPGTLHYGYSDMTGIVSRNATTSFGYWSVVHDSRIEQTNWSQADWTASVPPDTSLVVTVRSSSDGSAWSSWETAQNGNPLTATPPGRYLEIRVEMRAPTGGTSPVLEDISVTAAAPGDTDLVAGKTCTTAAPRAEHLITYEVTVTNTGANWASGVVVTDTLPPDLEVLSIDTPGGANSLSSGVLTVNYIGIAPGDAKLITVTGIPWQAGPHSNQVGIVADRSDTNPSDNDLTLVTDVAALVCTPPPSGLLGWWPGDGNGIDLVAGRDLGEWNGASFGPARVGDGFILDGVDDFLELPDASAIHSDRAVSLTGWFKCDAFHRTWQNIIYKGGPVETGGAENREFSLWLNSQGYLYFTSTPVSRIGIGELIVQTAAGSIQTDTWYQFATIADADNGSMQIWVNGELAAEGPFDRSGIRTTEGPLRIGVNITNYENFRGAIDDVAIFGSALNGSEIATLYDVRSASMCNDKPVVAAPDAMPPGIVGQAYAQTLAAKLGQPPYTWSIASGNLPAGLSLSAAGGITGIPTSAGNSTFTARVTDDNSDSADREFEINVGTCLMPNTDMAAWWPGEGNGDDWIGESHGTVGARTYFVPGVRGQAFHFVDNAESYIIVPNTPAVQVPETDPQFTIEAWVRPDFNVLGSKLDTILGKRDACGGNFSYIFGVYKGHSGYVGNLYLSMTGLPGSSLRSTGTIPDDGRFHHVAATYKHDKPTDNIILWIDGQAVGSLTTAVIPPAVSEGPNIGRHNTCGYYSTSTMDEIVFHQVELSAAEILARFEANNAGYCDPPDADLAVKLTTEPAASYATDDLREPEPPVQQVKSDTVDPLATASFDVKIENDSAIPRSFVLRASETGTDGWTRAYQGPGGDIKAMIKGASGYTTAELALGASETITVQLTPGLQATGGLTATSTITAHRDSGAESARDAVRVEATSTVAALTDMLVRRVTDVVYLGDDVRNATGANQGKTTEIAAGQSAHFIARLANDGNGPTQFRLSTIAPGGDWTLQCTGPEGGLHFDGVNDAIRITDKPTLRPASLTAEGWFLATNTSGERHFISKPVGPGSWNSYVLWINNGTLNAVVMDSVGAYYPVSFDWNSLPAGWHHVAMTFDDATDDLRLFVNGAEKAQRTAPIDIWYDAHPLLVGIDMVGMNYSGPLAGQALEVRLWDHARSEAEIQAGMNAAIIGTETGLIGAWPLNEGAGLVANDLTGRHPGDLINGAAWLFTGSVDLTTDITSPAGWGGITLSPGQSYDFTVTLSAGAAAPAGSRCDLLIEGSNTTGTPATSDTIRVSGEVRAAGTGTPAGRTFTSNEDFDFGTLVGVEFSSIENQLQLSQTAVTLPFLWVPNSNQGTISKVDTRSGQEIGRYRVCPDATYGNPSRTTVDLRGNCWVGNRRIGTAVKVGLFESGSFVDRNDDGIIQTSRDDNADGIISGAELLPWGEDECVLLEVVVIPGKEGPHIPGTYTGGYANDDWNPGPRGLAIDAGGDLWLGSFGPRNYHKIDGETGAILTTVDVSSVAHTPYGAVIDSNGILWSSGSGQNHVLRLDPVTQAFEVIALGHHSYGLGIDANDHLFVSGWQNTALSRININTGIKEWTVSGVYESRGVAVTPDGDVWTANSGPGTVTRWSPDGAIKTSIEVGNQPTGVAVDADGKVWVVNYGDEYVKRIDPATNSVTLARALTAGTVHYGYSDMTGMVARTATSRFGTWTVTHDSGASGAQWDSIAWNSFEPEGLGLGVRVRTSADGLNWSAWTTVDSGDSLGGLAPGRFLQVGADFQAVPTGGGDESPILFDLTVTPTAGRPPLHISFDGGGSLGLSGTGSPDDYILESTPTLAPPDWQPIVATPNPEPGGFSYILPPQGTRHFYRLRRK